MTENVDLNTSLHKVAKAAFCNDQLARGINESCRAIEARYGPDTDKPSELCLLASDCDNENYVKLIVALCKTNGVRLHRVEKREDLGIWAGLCKYDETGKPRKVTKCSCLVIQTWPQREQANVDTILQHLNAGPSE